MTAIGTGSGTDRLVVFPPRNRTLIDESFRAVDYLRDPEAWLQFLYDINVIGYSEQITGGGETFFHWSNREKSLNNMAPKIKSTGTFQLNSGIAKSLDIGKSVDAPPKPAGTQQPRRKRVRHRRS
jgi:hypothetical protein